MIEPSEIVDNKSALKVAIQLAMYAPDEDKCHQCAYIAMNLSSQMTKEEVEQVRRELVETLRYEITQDITQLKQAYDDTYDVIYKLDLPTID